MSSYKDLDVYKKSIDLSIEIYKITTNFPNSEIYGLTSQVRRCGISISSNIAEGQSRGHLNEYIHFLWISYGSCAELETQLLIAHKIGFIKEDDYRNLNQKVEDIMKMLNKLISVLRKKIK